MQRQTINEQVNKWCRLRKLGRDGLTLLLGLLVLLAMLDGVRQVPAASGRGLIRVPADYATIGMAVAMAESGDIIEVSAGTYPENVSINRSLILRGAGAGQTIIDGQGLWTVVSVANGATVLIEGVTLFNGRGVASGYGGGLHNQESVVTLRQSEVISSTAYAGGGVTNRRGTMVIENSLIMSNTAEVTGAGLLNLGILEVKDSVVDSNRVLIDSAINNGGGILNGQNAEAVLKRVEIRANESRHGAGLFVDKNSTVVMEQSLIHHNQADIGGGVSLDLNSLLTIQDTTFNDNRARLGGGLFAPLSVTLTIKNSQFENNLAVRGGGLMLQNTQSVRVEGTHFQHNEAELLGGGIFNMGGVLFLTDTSVRSNSAGDSGGGIHLLDGELYLTRSLVADNQAANIGGGLQSIGGTLSAINSTISRNQAAIGGGLATFSAEVWLDSVTLLRNRAPLGGGLFNQNGMVQWRNSVSAEAVEGADCVLDSQAELISQGHNADSDNSCRLTPSLGDLPGIVADLGPLGDHGGPTWSHMPQLHSPLVDAGTGTDCPAVDQRGVARPLDGDGSGSAECDIGAVERDVAAPPLQLGWLPVIIR